jgi:hypothetical protein
MRRAPLLLTAFALVLECDSAAEPAAAPSGPSRADASKAPASGEAAPAKAAAPAETAADAPAPTGDAWAGKLAGRKLAASGLDVGSKLSAFDIVNCESGDTYCQVCRFGGSPKIMVVGTADDESFKKDLAALDALAKKFGEDEVKAFAVVTDLKDGKAVTPSDVEAARAKADALRKELGIAMPVVVPAPDDSGPNRVWDEYYNITQSRTVMFADGRNNVVYSAVAPSDLSQLEKAIGEVVGPKAG